MTQKSLGRRRRDQLQAAMDQQNIQSPYVELDEMYTYQRGLFKPYYDMACLIIMPEVVPYLKDVQHTNNLLRGLSAEVRDLFDRTEKLHARHAGKNKMPDAMNEDEHFEIIQLFQEYQMYMGVHQQNILPVMLELDEHLQYALRARGEAEAQAISEGVAAHQADVAITQAASPTPQYVDVPAPAAAAPTMAAYEAAATPAQ